MTTAREVAAHGAADARPAVALPRVAAEPVDGPDAAALVAAQVREMKRRYGDGGPSPLLPQQVTPPHGVFLVARRDGEPVGCGGLRTLSPGTGELKRMYVAPAARRQGVGLLLLDRLVDAARDLGMSRLLLETGVLQPEALALYEREGWTRVPAYGEFREDPRSVCLALELAERPRRT